jgi:hypothetical protein
VAFSTGHFYFDSSSLVGDNGGTWVRSGGEGKILSFVSDVVRDGTECLRDVMVCLCAFELDGSKDMGCGRKC